MPTLAEISAEVNGPCRMRPPKRDFAANASSTCSGLKSPNRPAPSTRCDSVTVTAVPKRSPICTSSYHLPGNIGALCKKKGRHPCGWRLSEAKKEFLVELGELN